MSETKTKARNTTLRTWLLIWGLGLAGQLCWNIENQWFNTFIYAKIAKDPSIVSWMVAVSAIATTFSTFFFGTLSDRIGRRKILVVAGYATWGVFTIIFGLTEFISKDMYMFAAVSVVLADALMSFVGSMGNDSGFNAWTNDVMNDRNRGHIGAALATQPVIGTIVGTVVGGMIIDTNGGDNYMALFITMGVAVILFAVVAQIFMKEDPSLKPNKEGSFWKQFASVFSFKKFFSRKELLLVNIAVTVFFVGFNVYFAQMGNYMIYYLNFTAGEMGLIQGISLILAMALVIPSTIFINKNKCPLVGYLAIAFNLIGLMIMYIFVRPDTVDPSGAFAVGNLVLFLSIFFIGVGYMTILQTTTVWAKQLYPKDSKGQFEGIRILFFVLIPMVLGSIIASLVVKGSGLQFDNPETGRLEYLPNEMIFLVGALITIFTIIPLLFASKHYRKRVAQEAQQAIDADIEDDVATDSSADTQSAQDNVDPSDTDNE